MLLAGLVCERYNSSGDGLFKLVCCSTAAAKAPEYLVPDHRLPFGYPLIPPYHYTNGATIGSPVSVLCLCVCVCVRACACVCVCVASTSTPGVCVCRQYVHPRMAGIFFR